MKALAAFARHVHVDDLGAFHAAFVELKASAGQALVREGIANDALWVVSDGVFVVEVDDGAAVLGEIGPGSGFGELSLLTGEVASATVRARGAATVWKIDRAAITTLRARRPQAEVALIRMLSEDLAVRVRAGTAALARDDGEAPEGRRVRLRSALARLFGRRG
jgi:CRP-like cAMP-binding protein